MRALRRHGTAEPAGAEERTSRKRKYDATIQDAVTALWEAADRICGKRLMVIIPTLLPALERHGRLKLEAADRQRVLAISAATIDRMLCDVKVAAAGGRRRRAGFYSAIRREVPIRTFDEWNDLLQAARAANLIRSRRGIADRKLQAFHARRVTFRQITKSQRTQLTRLLQSLKSFLTDD